jgi:hypothetical protein
MKKIIVLILVSFAFFGCGEELEFNTPSFQGEKDGNLWEAVSFSANINSLGQLTVLASDNFETITLQTNSAAIGLYDVSQTNSYAALIDINDIVYSTNNFPDPSVQLYPAAGVIDLKDVNIEEGYVSGEFYFNAFNSSGLSSININKGLFFKVPLLAVQAVTGGIDIPCTTATSAVSATLISYSASSPGDTNYVSVCSAYKTALTTQKNSCGDADGSIQAIIDGLSCI